MDVEDLKSLWGTSRCMTHVVKAVLVCAPRSELQWCLRWDGMLRRRRWRSSWCGLGARRGPPSDPYAHVVFANVSAWSEALGVTEPSTRQAITEVQTRYNHT